MRSFAEGGTKIAAGAGAAEVDPAEVAVAEAGPPEAEPGVGSAELGAEAGADVATEAGAHPVAPAGVQAVCGSAVVGETVASEPRQMLAAHTIIANRQTAPLNQRILKL